MREAPFPSTVPWLFYRREQLAIQTSDLIYSFILTSKGSGDILAVFHCVPGPNGWISPPLAPFGGIMPVGNCHSHQLTFLLDCIREWVADMGGNMLTVKTAPSCYDPHAYEICHRACLSAGFLPNHTYSNHYIPIASQCFDRIIEPAERRRLAKGKVRGLRVTMYRGISDKLAEGFLHRCYNVRGYKFPAPPDQLARFITASPENYLVFTNWLEDEPVAMAIMVRVSDGILYHFMSGYLPEYRALSPALMLFEAAFEYCRKEKISVLDLGISIDHLGNPKPSLSRFKANIGGLECKKVVYQAQF
ncbi:Acetyltransferase (GNAT) domain-containing protein [Dyadobacter sp. SG02]|nr:Acetyltransferase (GNAT) domain-containing protein [Dyadobacter sp. SG02]